MKLHHLLVLVFAALFAACAGSPKSVAHSGSSDYSAGYEATESYAPSTTGTANVRSTSVSSGRHAPTTQSHSNNVTMDSDGAYQPAPRHRPRTERRPGLGTVFGETVTSHVSMKTFVRASSRPFATVAMHYNDASGVRAHANYVGSKGLAPYRAYTPAGGITVALTDQYGNLLTGGEANGRALIVGNEGQRYNIIIQNHTAGRFEVVASVDGLDVIDGKPGNLSKRGYILEPHSTLTIDGFRRSESAVAAFRFGRVSQSYAARTAGARNVGVVGTAFFAERGSVWTTDELRMRDTADPFPDKRNFARPPSY